MGRLCQTVKRCEEKGRQEHQEQNQIQKNQVQNRQFVLSNRRNLLVVLFAKRKLGSWLPT